MKILLFHTSLYILMVKLHFSKKVMPSNTICEKWKSYINREIYWPGVQTNINSYNQITSNTTIKKNIYWTCSTTGYISYTLLKHFRIWKIYLKSSIATDINLYVQEIWLCKREMLFLRCIYISFISVSLYYNRFI